MKKITVAMVFLVFLMYCGLSFGEQANAGKDAGMIPGAVITFGRYEQDNDLENGPEAIEWIVLDVEDSKALLLSKYGLEVKQYNARYVATTWETCTIRKWLNGDFLQTAFTEEEQQAILITEVGNSPAQGHSRYQANSGNNTQDQIFLLSYQEANRYLDVTYEDRDNVKARVAPTAHAIAHHAWQAKGMKTEEGVDAGRWWLRSPGRHPNRACHIVGPGCVRDNQVTSGSRLFGYGLARPALWVTLK